MDKPIISVIVPVYNTEKYLHRCIDSILAQTFTDFELLLIDDGSKDNSGAICDEYATIDNRVRVFHKDNGGVCSARNVGLDNAIGEWVTFCDSDDWVFDSWLENFVANIGDTDLVCQGIRFDKSLFNQDTIDSGFDYTGNVQGLLNIFYEWDVGYTVIKCFKRMIIDRYKILFDVRFNYHEDEEFVLKYLAYCNRAKSTSKVGYNYLVPNPAVKKYRIKNSLSLYNSLYNSAKVIYRGNSNKVMSHYLDGYTMMLLTHFKKCISIKSVRDYKKSVGKFILSSKLFGLTKWTIYLDPTYIVSAFVLFLHSNFKFKL